FTESPMNISVGQVVAVRDERIVTLDTFDPEDQSALFARFEELRTGRAESPVERVVSEFVRAFNERDWKALADVYVDDLEHVDRRAISTWGDLRSRDDVEEIRIEREGSPVERAGLAFVRAFNTRDWEAPADVYTEDCEHVDRRSLTTWGDMQSRGDILITLRHAADLTPDIRVRTEIIATD